MGGEFGIDVEKVRFSRDEDLTKPFGKDRFSLLQYIDMDVFSTNKSVIHICGRNDWGYLVVDALMPLIQYGESVFSQLRNMIDNYEGTPEVIMLGKNEYRAVDILHRLRGVGEPINIFLSIPIVKSEENNYIKLLGSKKELAELPFK